MKPVVAAYSPRAVMQLFSIESRCRGGAHGSLHDTVWFSAITISDDGRVIIGSATRLADKPSYEKVSFVVVIPEPSTGLLVAAGLAILGRRRCTRIA